MVIVIGSFYIQCVFVCVSPWESLRVHPLPLILYSLFQPPSQWNKTQPSSKSHSRTNSSQTTTYCKCPPLSSTILQGSSASHLQNATVPFNTICRGQQHRSNTLSTVSHILNPLEPVRLPIAVFVYPDVWVCVSVCRPLRCLVKCHSSSALITEAGRGRCWNKTVHFYLSIWCYF